MTQVRISLVTPSLNQARFLERTLESVLSQRGAFELDYLVLDGGSTDGSVEILRRYEGRLRYRVEPDTGQANAVNKGLREAKGEIVGWINSDDVLMPGALDRVARAFAASPGLLWLHGRCEIIDEADRPIRRWISAYKDRRCRRYSRRALLLENFVSQMTVFWRRELHAEVGYLDESMRYAFDYEFWLRLAERGDPAYLPETLAAFRWYRTSKSGGHFARQFAEDMDAFRRHAPPGLMIRLGKRLKSTQIVAAYRILRLLGAGG